VNIKEILQKIGEGKELTEEEKSFLAEYDPEKDESRIPKSRLDQEIQKAKSEKERADKLDNELSELKDRLEELENSGKTEAEKARIASEKELNKLKTQIANLEKERDDAKSSLAKSERTSKIAALAQKHGFSDAEYLDYLTSAKSIDIDDENAISGFMKELTANSPQHFQSRAKSGGGTGKGSGGSQNDVRLKELLGKKELTLQEAAEVAKIQSEDGSEAKGE
jgi:DNA repair exonuclease SbcCD ATPase subunit